MHLMFFYHIVVLINEHAIRFLIILTLSSFLTHHLSIKILETDCLGAPLRCYADERRSEQEWQMYWLF